MSVLRIPVLAVLLAAASQANPLLGELNLRKGELADAEIDYRLPKTAEPIHYEILLKPRLTDDYTFEGESKIQIKVLKGTNKLTLNALDLKIKENAKVSHKVKKGDGKDAKEVEVDVPAVKTELDPVRQFLIVEFKETLEPKEYTLHLTFSGTLNRTDMRGFYRSSYLNADGDKKWLAVTHFEPTGARLAFPCFDEPQLKAEFTISIQHAAKYSAISNTKGKTESMPDENYKLTKFERSKKMSTYLVAFVVSDYVPVTEDDDSFYKVWTKRQAADSAVYALKIGKKAIKELDAYTEIKYSDSMSKMDQVSVPDFAPSAMENWGLVTYAEKSLLYTKGVTSTGQMQSITTVIVHEFAHQWFGNLVSPNWWTYLWLSEGFATYFQYFITNKMVEGWRLDEQFVAAALQGSAFEKDSQDNTHAINHAVSSPEEIKATFDAIAYQKAGSVIRMMSHILTEKVFHAGLKSYLKTNSYKSVSAKSLLDALQKAATDSDKLPEDFDIHTIMEEWLNKPGYPVVHVKRDKEKGDLVLSQERFCDTPGDETKWWIPINYVTEENPDFTETKPVKWLKPNGKTITIEKTNSSLFVLVNKQQTGFYRVNYDEANWELLTKYLMSDMSQKIVPVNRAQLIDDAFSLARFGKLSYSTALKLSKYLATEKDYIPWVASFRHLNFLNSMLSSSEKYGSLKKYFAQQMKGIIEIVKFDPSDKDDHIIKLARPDVLKWACAMGVEECTTHAQKKFAAWLADPVKNELDVDLRENIMCAGLRDADRKVLDATREKYTKAADKSQEKKQLLVALSCSTSKEFLEEQLRKTLEEKTGNEFDTFVKAVVKNSPVGVDIAMDVIRENYTDIQQFDQTGSKIKSYLNQIGEKVNTASQFVKLGVLISSKKVAVAQSADAFQKAGKNLNWINDYSASITNWIDGHLMQQNNSATSLSLSAFLFIIPILLARFY